MSLAFTSTPVFYAFMAGLFVWAVTSLGSAVVFLTKTVSRRTLEGMLGFAGGIMLAASFWSLLSPSIEMSKGMGVPSWFPPLIGFVAGGVFLRLLDLILPHIHIGFPAETAEGVKVSWKRSTLLVLAITLHNIPEGLAVGVVFGAISSSADITALTAAITLAIGIGIQDFPEGIAISIPLRGEGLSRIRSFFYGQLSGFVEFLAAMAGAAAVTFTRELLPYALAFAAGAMVFVVVEEVIPESQSSGNYDLSTTTLMIGFVLMMFLEVAFA